MENLIKKRIKRIDVKQFRNKTHFEFISEEANRSHLQMRKVRAQVDVKYCAIIYLLETAVALNDTSPVYEALFAELNARITRYANTMAQEKGRRKKKTETEQLNMKHET